MRLNRPGNEAAQRRPPVRQRRSHTAVVRCVLASLVATLLYGCGPSADSISAPLFSFGQTGLGPGELSYPRAGVWGPGDRLFIVDKSGRIQCFNADGKFVLDWRMPECTAGKPTGLGVGPDGRIYAADTHYARVMIFESDGRPVRSFGEWGDGAGQFRLPTDVAVDPDGFIYVSEYGGNDRINKFAPTGEYLLSFGRHDQQRERTERPQALAIDQDSSIWVADSCNHRIIHFSAAGEYIGEFGRAGVAPGEMRFPYSIDFLADGTIVVAEYGNNRLQRFARDGKSLGIWGRAGKLPGELAYPWAAICGKRDRVYAVDSGSNRIQVFDARAFRPPTFP